MPTATRPQPAHTGPRNAAHPGEPVGRVFNIQKYSLHDGDGIRTLVFLKGCPLACAWCSNPESQSFGPELLYTPDRCMGQSACDRCIGACDSQALAWEDDAKLRVDRTRCDGCGACAPACPPRALEVSGDELSVSEVIRVVEEDDAFYVRSGGGLTVGGGEPMAQPGFTTALLAAAKHRGLDTAMETCGLCAWEALAATAPHLDRIFFDLKCIDSDKHKRYTGVSNHRILENFQRLRAQFPNTRVIVRTAVIPGVNDSEADIGAIASFIANAGGAAAYELLPYHAFGEPKYRKLGRSYPLADVDLLTETHMAALRRIADQAIPLR